MCYSAMKTVSLLLHRNQKNTWSFITSPYLSMRSLNYHPLQDKSLIVRFILFFFLTVFSIILAREFLVPMNYLEIVLFAPAIYFFTEAMGAIGQILFFKTKSFPIHRSPLKASSLSHFWGRDWNLWVQDWLRDISEGFSKRNRKRRIIMVFLVSGLFHEMMVNLPYWIMNQKSYFGTMLGYFLIQAVALWVDKKVMIKFGKKVRRVYLWLAVILPSPLFINVPLLKFFGLIDA